MILGLVSGSWVWVLSGDHWNLLLSQVPFSTWGYSKLALFKDDGRERENAPAPYYAGGRSECRTHPAAGAGILDNDVSEKQTRTVEGFR